MTAETTIPAIGTKSGRPGNRALLLLRTTGVRTMNPAACGCKLRSEMFWRQNQDKRVAEHPNLPTIQNVAERTALFMRIDTNIAASPELRASIGKPFLCIENYRWNGLIYPNGTLRPCLTKAAEI